MPFVVGGSAPLGSVLGSSSPLSPLTGSAPLSSILSNGAQSPVEAGETAAMPRPDIVYEPSAPQHGALLTYAPPRGPDRGLTAAEGEEAVVADGEPDGDDKLAEEAAAIADADTSDDDIAVADAGHSVAIAASFHERRPSVAGSESLAMASPVSVQVARATQVLQASQPAPMAMPGEPASAQVADPHAQSQLMAQAVYTLIADAHAHGRAIDDLIKFA